MRRSLVRVIGSVAAVSLLLPALVGCAAPLLVTGADGSLPSVPVAEAPQGAPGVQVASSEDASAPPKLMIRTPRIAVIERGKITFTGTVSGALESSDTVRVEVQRKKGGGWVPAYLRTASRKRKSATYRSWAATIHPWRRARYRARAVVAAADGRFPTTATRWVTFRVVGRKHVALTFDGGPWPTTTDSVRRTLQRYHATGTFFIIGNHLKLFPAPAKRVAAAGFPMQSHTMTHPDLTTCSDARIRSEIRATAKLVEKVSKKRVTMFRPPMGATNSHVAHVARAAGYTQVMWDLDSWDLLVSSARERRRVVSKVRSGDVVLMHDGGGEGGPTSRALPGILHDLRGRGWDFVTVQELYALRH